MTITICRSDDTDFNDLNLLKIKISTDLDFTGYSARFLLGDVVKTFSDISSKEFIVNFTKEETSKLPYGNLDGKLIVIDNEKREKCFVATIDFHITNTPPEAVAQELDIYVTLNDTTYEYTCIMTVSPGKVSDLTNDMNYQTASDVTAAINVEKEARENADIELRQLISEVQPTAGVKDIVNTYSDLINYSTTGLLSGDVIGVIADNTYNDTSTYYRWIISNNVGSWQYIGSLGSFYTKTEADIKFVALSELKSKGSSTVPVYFDTDGKAQTITSYSGNAATATSATNDGNGNEIATTYVNLTGTQTITGTKTFSQSITAPTFVGDLTGNATSATSATNDGSGNAITSTYVNLTGTQTITGAKTFTSPVTASSFVGDLTGNATSATSATKDGNGDTITSTYVNLAGNQTITGAKIFSSAVTAFSFIGDLTGNATSADTATSATTAASADTATTLTGLTASVTELNYVDGVTSSVQTQLNDKFSSADIQTAFGLTPSDLKVPSEKLTKDTIDDFKAKFQVVNSLPVNPDPNTFYFIKEA